jgi:hypothetical protein
MGDKFRRALLALAVLLGGIGGALVSTPAQASYADCPQTYVCLWTNAYYGGSLYKWTPGSIQALPNHCVQLSSGINAQASSIAGKYGSIGSPVTFYGSGGGSFGRDAAFSDNNLGDSSGIVGWNNRISTICVLP